jgi:pyruvate/2-oxoglutarate dehydrogenase complex dihydrolipoamide acyltransferase (E2) component
MTMAEATEAAEREAAERGIDLDSIEGTGADGQITVDDVKAADSGDDDAGATDDGSEHRDEGLEHTEGGRTTRDDPADLGVSMLPGSADEPVGPEDALGAGPKRGDYSDRVGPSDYNPHEVVAGDDGVEVNAQRPRASEQGDEAGAKGGVETA